MHISVGALTRRLLLAVALVAGLALVPTGQAAAEGTSRDYIVVLDDTAGDPALVAAEHLTSVGGDLRFVYRHALKGYAASLPPEAVAVLEADPRVDFVEADAIAHATATQNTSADYWNIDRVDQRTLPLSGTYTYTSTGTGVRIYILDTGIRYTHTQFGGRAIPGFDGYGGDGSDCDGHGTHVAGTAGGATVGVGRSATLVSVRVLDCNGSGAYSTVIAGVDWVTGNHVAGAPAVANMSLTGPTSSALDSAVNNSITDGVTYTVAAGNGDRAGRQQPACNYSPARVPAAVTISATSNTDAKPKWANYGSCVDWFAPGVRILSAWYTGDTAGAFLDGTSMAAPLVAGVASQYLQLNPSASPATVRQALYDLTTKGIVTSSSTTDNHLLFTNL